MSDSQRAELAAFLPGHSPGTAYFATDAEKGQLADLELRHRRARCEDQIGCAKDTGLRSLPLKGFAQNQVWCEIAALACELLAWMQMLALDGTARRWEPKRLRLRLLSAAGRLARGGRRLRLRLAERWPWTADITAAVTRMQALPSADQPEPSLRHIRSSPGGGGTPPTSRRVTVAQAPAPAFQVPGEAFDVGATGGEQVHGAGTAPGGELAQIQGVRLSCQPAVPRQEAGEREPFGIAECCL